MAAQTVRDWRRAARSKVHSYPDIKQKTKDATNSDLWGPTDAQKSEIAEASFNEENRTLVLKALWKRVDDKSEYWMHVYKALDVLEYLLLCDVPGVFNDLRFHHQQLTQLQHYLHAKHKEPKESEKLNDKVRIKAAKLLNLMGDGDLLVSERAKLRLIMARITGVSDSEAFGTAGTGAAGATGAKGGVKPHEAPHTRPSGKSGVQQSTLERELGGGGGSAAPPGDDFELDMEVLGQLMEMGFTDQTACVTAMMQADNNLERSVQYILASPNQGREPEGDDAANTGRANTTAPPPALGSGGGQNNTMSSSDRGMSDLFTPPVATSTSQGGGGGQQPVVDIFGEVMSNSQNTSTGTNGTTGNNIGNNTQHARGASGNQYGLWKPETPSPTTSSPPPPVAKNSGFDFDPFADPTPKAAPPPATTNINNGGMQDFFVSNARPQEARRHGVSPPAQQQQQPVAQQQDLFGNLVNNNAPPPQQQTVDLFGNPVPSSSYSAPQQQQDLFGNPAPGQKFSTSSPTTTSPAISSPAAQAGGQAGGAGRPLTKQEKMMQEFNMMGKPPAPKNSSGQQKATLDQMMRSGGK